MGSTARYAKLDKPPAEDTTTPVDEQQPGPSSSKPPKEEEEGDKEETRGGYSPVEDEPEDRNRKKHKESGHVNKLAQLSIGRVNCFAKGI